MRSLIYVHLFIIHLAEFSRLETKHAAATAGKIYGWLAVASWISGWLRLTTKTASGGG